MNDSCVIRSDDSFKGELLLDDLKNELIRENDDNHASNFFDTQGFKENGFFVVEDIIEAEKLDHLARKIFGSFNRSEYHYIHNPDNRIHCSLSLDEVSDAVIRQAVSPFSLLLRSFLKNEKKLVELSSITVFPGARAQDIHPDQTEKDKNLVSIFINICPTTIDSGCLWVVPGSHQQPHHAVDKSQAVPICCPAGSVVFMNSKVWHYGGANTTIDRIRPVFYFSFGDSDIAGPTYSISKDVQEKNFDINDFCEDNNTGNEISKKINASEPIENINPNDVALDQYNDIYEISHNSIIHAVFPTSIYRNRRMCDSQFLSDVVQKIIHKHSFDDSLDYVLGKQPTGEIHGKIFLHKEKKLTPFFCGLRRSLVEYFECLDLDTQMFEFYITKCWLTKIQGGQVASSIRPHIHSFSDASFVYYLPSKSDEALSSITFHKSNQDTSYDPHFDYNECNGSAKTRRWLNSSIYSITPDPGDLLIFPGDLVHEVAQNETQAERLSIAGDVVLTLKPEFVDKIYSRTNPQHWEKL